MRTARTLLPVPLSRFEKRKLKSLAAASGIPMSTLLRQLLLREYADMRRVRRQDQTITQGGR